MADGKNSGVSQILAKISREIYAIRPLSGGALVSSASSINQELHEWRASLPPLLGAINPSSLVAPFRRQSTAVRLAYAHAVIHANRPFLLSNLVEEGGRVQPRNSETQVLECIYAAGQVLEMVDTMVGDGTLFYAFWWTHYVAFCALAVVYIWEIQEDKAETASQPPGDLDPGQLFELAERCQAHLGQATAANSPSRRYSIILQELREEAKQRNAGACLAVAITSAAWGCPTRCRGQYLLR